jgi:hypothetical protein
MSVRRNTSVGFKRQAPKPYCKACHDAGKSETDYTSHFVRDKPGPDGLVICPTILNNECRYCHNTGHFPSTCPKRVRDEKGAHERERRRRIVAHEEARAQETKTRLLTNVAKFCGSFAVLGDDGSSDSDESPRVSHSKQVKVREAFPSLCAAPVRESIAGTGYAAALAKPKLSKDLADIVRVAGVKRTASTSLPTPVACEPRPKKILKPVMQRSWANDSDWESSDDEGDSGAQQWKQAEDSW